MLLLDTDVVMLSHLVNENTDIRSLIWMVA